MWVWRSIKSLLLFSKEGRTIRKAPEILMKHGKMRHEEELFLLSDNVKRSGVKITEQLEQLCFILLKQLSSRFSELSWDNIWPQTSETPHLIPVHQNTGQKTTFRLYLNEVDEVSHTEASSEMFWLGVYDRLCSLSGSRQHEGLGLACRSWVWHARLRWSWFWWDAEERCLTK